MKKQTEGKREKKQEAVSSKRNSVNPEKILDAAMELMSEHGYAGTSISRICEKSGFPATSIYWHFGSKERLLTAAIERAFVRWMDAHPDGIKLKGGYQERIMEISALDARYLEDQPEFMRLMFLAGLERRSADPEVMKMVARIRQHAREFLIHRIQAFVRASGREISSELAEPLARFWIVCSDGAFLASQVEPEDADIREIFRQSGWAIISLLEKALLDSEKEIEKTGSGIVNMTRIKRQ